MSTRLFTGPRMPRDLLDKIGAPQKRPDRNTNGGRRDGPLDRKARRKMERDDKRRPQSSRREILQGLPKRKPEGTGHKIQEPAKTARRAAESTKNAHGFDSGEDDGAVNENDRGLGSSSEDDEGKSAAVVQAPADAPKRKRDAEDIAQAPRKKSRKEEDDDADVAALQKKLGIKSKKLPTSFGDGLGDLLGDLDDESEDDGNGEYETWLRQKRGQNSKPKSHTRALADDDGDSSENGGEQWDDFDEDSGFDEAFSEDDVESPEEPVPRKKENPYVAPVTTSNPVQKYIPPSLRQESASDAELQSRLRRQIKGQLNRLSEANILSILSEIEKLYTANPRQYVTSGLIDLLIELTSDPAILNDTFLVLHAGFIAAVYKVIGPDFGAQFLDHFVRRFDHCYASITGDNEGNKSTTNLVSLLSQLYNLQVVSSIVVFDYLRLFLGSISEHHTELLLRIVRSSGQQLRQDDPTALKDIAAILQKSINRSEGNEVSVRTRFMVETITSLKDNRLKQNAANSALMSEHLTRMRKTLGTMNSRALRATEPLNTSLKDIREADKRGKWWLVGASWKGSSQPTIDAATSKPSDPESDSEHKDGDPEVDLIALARANKMTTPLRQRIFVALLSASDCRDAHVRLRKLNLTHKQSLDIPRVLIHCAGVEKAYNPFWGLVAHKVCREKGLAKAFVFGAYGLYRRMGAGDASGDVDDDEEEGDTAKPSIRETLNLAKLFADLLSDRAIPITLLKHLDLPSLPRKSRAHMFAEVLLVSTILRAVNKKRSDVSRETDARRRAVDEDLCAIFGIGRNEAGFALGLRWFFEHVIQGSDLAANKTEARSVRKASEMIVRRLGDADVGGYESQQDEIESD